MSDVEHSNEITHIVIMQSLGSLHELVNRVLDRQDHVEGMVASVQETANEIDRRVLTIESNSVNSRVVALEAEVRSLREKDAIRVGHAQAAGAVQKYGPLVVSVVLAIFVLAQSGIIHVGG